ncbi:uncharacterized protein LOC114719912 [Neltuma alba]|uniref:uncharacterized protein LOC114719912 n=1 Tax=Neltuma alba TaxID=207710 RepID=UPI0010A34A90|nr:uncharacterized protein LOC114719912 [Prosopis alba]XP_028761320.1 uncharacterized protein LOC114719912 [Prosopis alba]
MKIGFLTLLLLLLAFSYALSASAVPATRSRNLMNLQDALPLSSLLPQMNDAVELGNGAEVEGEAELIEGRMELETQDYGGTGANKDHDPKTPGKP